MALRPHSAARCLFFFFNDTATTEIYTLSLHDALPIYASVTCQRSEAILRYTHQVKHSGCRTFEDRKSTRLNSSHVRTSYAVFCLKKKRVRVTAKALTVGGAVIEHRARLGGVQPAADRY